MKTLEIILAIEQKKKSRKDEQLRFQERQAKYFSEKKEREA